MSLPREAFLSHASQDHALAAKVAATLRGHGVPVWYSPHNILGAQQWHDEIGAALHRCDWFLLLLSPDAVASKWVKRETLFALSDDRYSDRIVPVLSRHCDYAQLSWVLGQLQFIDMTHDFANGSRKLLQVWGIGFQPHLLAG